MTENAYGEEMRMLLSENKSCILDKAMDTLGYEREAVEKEREKGCCCHNSLYDP